MSEMVDRVAKAIRTSFATTGLAWEKLEPEIRARWIGYARAAIEAMREPTEEMIHHVYEVNGYGAGSDWSEDLRLNYRAMLDATLTEKPRT